MTHAVQVNLYRVERDNSISWLISRQCYLAQHELWTTTLIIAEHVASIKCRRALALTAQINGWIARKNTEGPNSIADEVSAWDVDGLSEHYQMAKALLQNDVDAARIFITRDLEEGKLTRFEIMNDPLYSDYRRSLVDT